MPKTEESVRRSRANMKDLLATNEREKQAIGDKSTAIVNATVEEGFSHQFRDGPGGRGLRMRKTWAMRAPWQKTIINGKVIDE